MKIEGSGRLRLGVHHEQKNKLSILKNTHHKMNIFWEGSPLVMRRNDRFRPTVAVMPYGNRTTTTRKCRDSKLILVHSY